MAKLDLTTTEEDVTNKTAAQRLAQEARQVTAYHPRPMRDITDEFLNASKFLQVGHLIKDEYFTLFEAVGALEIMDPKMDTGVVNAADSEDLAIDPSAELTVNEVIWTMDELICLEAAWLEDYPLSQTIFTSVHVDRILDPENKYPFTFEIKKQDKQTLTNQVLHPYCLALIKCCSMVLDLVRSQGFYEEEDFISHTFGRDLLPSFTTDEAVSRLGDALQWLTQNVFDKDLLRALEARLSFRLHFIQSIFGQINGWHTMIQLLDTTVETTHKLGQPSPGCFTDKVLRHLATSTPPRPKLDITWARARTQWKKMCADVAEAPQMTTFWIRQTPTCLQRAVRAFASRQPSTFPRSVIQDIILVDGKIADDVSHFDLLLSDIRELVLPGDELVEIESFQVEAVSDTRHKCSRLMEAFFDGMLDDYLNIYRLFCQNRARIRRDLTRSISIFDTLETQHAAKYDLEIAAYRDFTMQEEELEPLQTWVRYYKLKIMADTIQLGFETDIYLPDEMAHMYWYLSTLLNERHMLVDRIQAFTEHRASILRKDGGSRRLAECIVAMHWYAALKTEIDVSMHLAHALHSLFAILMSRGLITIPSRAFANSQLLYEARMKIYLGVSSPRVPSRHELLQAQTLCSGIDSTLDDIDRYIKLARAGLTALKTIPADTAKYTGTEVYWSAEIKKLETTAVAVVVAVMQLRRSEAKSTAVSLEVTFPSLPKRYHDYWVVPQVREKRQ